MDSNLLITDRPQESCGVFGIYAPGHDVARLTYFALYALQHRGQESAGIAVSDGRQAHNYKGMGLVAQVFREDNLRPLQGHIAIGHTRYSTTGASHIINAQPYLMETLLGPLGVAHNGNLVNAPRLRHELLKKGVGLSASSDSELIAQMLAGSSRETWFERIQGVMGQWKGAFTLTILTRDSLYAVRDPWGLRPLCLGRLDGGWVVASESCALNTVGAQYLREIEPGEIIGINQNGLQSIRAMSFTLPSLCSFEYIYFARPDSVLEDQTIHDVRQRLGRELAREHPVCADIVIAVPDSATPAAIGYAQESGIPYTEGLIKNRYIGRTFIQPDDRLRSMGVHLKYNPLVDNLLGKRVVLIDDSIVRGNTSGPMTRLLRAAGAAEVHIRVSSPPIRHPCFMGVNMSTYDELIAARLSISEIQAHLGCDSLAYLSLAGMLRAMGGLPETRCLGCFTGNYPSDFKEELATNPQEREAWLIPPHNEDKSLVIDRRGWSAKIEPTMSDQSPAIYNSGKDE
jgi:amidophosphoribosyltransferase